MDKKIRLILFLLAAYLLVFFIGFKSGTIYLRMSKKAQSERFEINPPSYLLVEKKNFNTYTIVDFQKIDNTSPIMQVFNNEKLRHLLKLRDIQIYKENGERIY